MLSEGFRGKQRPGIITQEVSADRENHFGLAQIQCLRGFGTKDRLRCRTHHARSDTIVSAQRGSRQNFLQSLQQSHVGWR